ncbi:MAG: DUF4142 domain-containing protein [Candidatus Binataceae bacterium]
MMKKIVPLGIGILLFTFAGVASAQELSRLLNKANEMNYEEVSTAKIAKDKAGDNQAMMTYAETIRGDHEANEDAASALARQRNIKFEGTDASKGEKSKLNDFNGGDFNQAYLDDQIAGHKAALSTFKAAEHNFKGDPNVELYIQQTLPILQAHLAMAENLKHHLSTDSDQNPANNKTK